MKRASFALVLVSLVAASLSSAELGAQETMRFPSRFVPRVSLAAAFDARNNGRGEDEMYLGLASLEWSTHTPGLAVRLDGIYARRDWIDRRQPLPECIPTCTPPATLGGFSYMASKVTAAGAMAGVTYQLRPGHALRPYVLASAGVVQTHDKFFAGTADPITCPTACILPASAASPRVARNDRPVSAAGHVGTGVAYSAGWISIFAEARYMTVDYANTRGLNGAVPISLGFSVGRPSTMP